MAPSVQILSVGYDDGLMESRSMLLRHAGYAVEDARSYREALALAHLDLFDIILICHTVPEAEQKELITIIRRQQRQTPILFIAGNAYSPTAFADNCRTIPSTPLEFLASVSSTVSEAPGLHG